MLTRDCLPFYVDHLNGDDVGSPSKLLKVVQSNIRDFSQYTFGVRYFREMTVKWDKNIQ